MPSVFLLVFKSSKPTSEVIAWSIDSIPIDIKQKQVLLKTENMLRCDPWLVNACVCALCMCTYMCVCVCVCVVCVYIFSDQESKFDQDAVEICWMLGWI